MKIEEIVKQFKFCSLCGGELEHREGKMLICKTCGKHTYINPVLANSAIFVNKSGEIVLGRRGIEPNKGLWDTLGGFINPGETVEESMVREFKEETGMDIVNIKYFTSQPDTYEYEGITYPVLAMVFVAEIDGGNLKASDDVSEIRFFKPSEIPYDDIAFEGVKKVLRKYIEESRD